MTYKLDLENFGNTLKQEFLFFQDKIQNLSPSMKKSIRYREESIELALSYYFAKKSEVPMWRIQSKVAFFTELTDHDSVLSKDCSNLFEKVLCTKGRRQKVNSDFSILAENLESHFPLDLVVEIKSELRTGLLIKSIFEDLILVHMYQRSGAKEAYSLVVTLQSETDLKNRLKAYFDKIASKNTEISKLVTFEDLLENNLIVVECGETNG